MVRVQTDPRMHLSPKNVRCLIVASQDTGLAIRGARACSLRLTGPPLPPVALPQQPAASESDSGAQSAQLTTVHCAGRHDVSRYMQGSCLSLSELCIQARLEAANESSIPPSAESKALCGVRQVPDAAFLTGGRQGGPVAGAAQAARGASHLRALLRLCSSTLCGSLTLAAQGLPEDLANEVVDRLLRGHRLDPPLLGLFAQAATALRLDAADWPSYQGRVSTAWLHAAAGFRCGRGVPAQLCVTPTSHSPKRAWQHMGPGRKWRLWVCTMHGTSARPEGHVHRVQ
jgi:hypothetical protein